MYIDLSYYKTNGGKAMEDTAFPKMEFRARMLLDKLTSGRIRTMKAVPEAVKRLMVELIGLEIGQGAEATERKSVTSFSNDGYSETYADPLTGEQVKEMQCSLISEYLAEETDDDGTPLLYLGV